MQLINHKIYLYFRLELENHSTVATNNSENNKNEEDNLAMENDGIPFSLKTAYIIYQQAFERIKNIKFIIELLNITKEYDNTEKLQKKIIKYVYTYINFH